MRHSGPEPHRGRNQALDTQGDCGKMGFSRHKIQTNILSRHSLSFPPLFSLSSPPSLPSLPSFPLFPFPTFLSLALLLPSPCLPFPLFFPNPPLPFPLHQSPTPQAGSPRTGWVCSFLYMRLVIRFLSVPSRPPMHQALGPAAGPSWCLSLCTWHALSMILPHAICSVLIFISTFLLVLA